MSVFNLTKAEDTEQRSASEPCIAVSVILQGAGMGVIMNHSGSETAVPYRAGTTYVCVMQQKLEALMKVPAGAVFSGVDIRLSLDFFDSSGHCPT